MEKIKSRLLRHGYTFTESKEKLFIDCGYKLIVILDFSDNKLKFYNKLKKWNLLCGVLSIGIFQAVFVNFIFFVLFSVLTTMLFIKDFNIYFLLLLSFYFMSFVLLSFIGMLYFIRYEFMKVQITNWLD